MEVNWESTPHRGCNALWNAGLRPGIIPQYSGRRRAGLEAGAPSSRAESWRTIRISDLRV